MEQEARGINQTSSTQTTRKEREGKEDQEARRRAKAQSLHHSTKITILGETGRPPEKETCTQDCSQAMSKKNKEKHDAGKKEIEEERDKSIV